MADHIASAPTRVGPVFDDSPFYFATDRPIGIAPSMALSLLILVVPVIGLLAVFVAFGRPAGAARAPYASAVVYFACLGAGFITVELALLQNLTLLLGHPIFTLSLLLFTLLAAGGLGSAASGRVPARVACTLVGGLAILYALTLPAIIPSLLPLGLSARVAIAIALTAPLGVVMGIPFPRGLRRAGSGALPAPPFFWGLNGVMSVLGSVGTVVVALTVGFRAAMLIGAFLYLVAATVAKVIDEQLPDRRP
jgi:hypothetical protein